MQFYWGDWIYWKDLIGIAYFMERRNCICFQIRFLCCSLCFPQAASPIGILKLSYMISLTTEKDCKKWSDQSFLWAKELTNVMMMMMMEWCRCFVKQAISTVLLLFPAQLASSATENSSLHVVVVFVFVQYPWSSSRKRQTGGTVHAPISGTGCARKSLLYVYPERANGDAHFHIGKDRSWRFREISAAFVFLRDFMAYYCVTEDELYGKQSYHFLSLAFFGECLSSLCGSARPVREVCLQ
jgi:hypothetical protein